jgi:UDP-glucose 4-epimerase
MRIVVTGGAGFIGKHVLDWLLDHGHSVRVIDDFSTGRAAHIPTGLQVDRVDLTTLTAREIALILRDFRADGVVHLAAMHFIPDCMARPERTFDVNTRVTHTLVEALSSYNVKRLVMASTMDVYSNEDHPHPETETPAPANVYGLSKLLSEEILACGNRREVCSSAVALRLANVYGPNETNPHLIPDVFDRLARPQGPELVMGYLGSSRDFVFVKEVAEAFGRAATAAPEGFHRLNVGTGKPVAVREVVQTLQRLFGDERPLRENAMAFRKFDRVSLTPCVEAIAATLGWRAQRRVAEGLAETVETLQEAANVAA